MPTEETTPAKETSQTPANEEETTEQKEETFTKAQLTEMLQKEIGKITAKNAKKLEAIQAELEAERRKALPDPEKIKAELADKDSKIKAYEDRLAAIEFTQKKRDALDAAKLTLPDDITTNDLLDMMPGNDDDAIAGYILRFKKMFPAQKALGTSTVTGKEQKLPDINDQIVAAEKAGQWALASALKLRKQSLG